MTEPYATIAGHLVERLVLRFPFTGPWWADGDFLEAPDVSGRVEIRVGGRTFSGTVVPRYSGTFTEQRRVRIVAGGGGWGTLLTPRAYHSDAEVTARSVADDAARDAGEELGATFQPALERIGIDYVRQAGPASRVLEDVIGGVPWWLDADGRTQVGPRPESEPSADVYELLEHDPRAGTVLLGLDDVGAVPIGSRLTERLDAPVVVRELEVEVGPSIVVRAWCAPAAPSAGGRLLRALSALVAREADGALHGTYRYRVVRMSGDRVDLQAVVRGGAVPDLQSISMRPGSGGSHAQLAQGAQVLVQFIEGSRRMPFVSHVAGKDGEGWVPVEALLVASSAVRLGEADASDGVAKSSSTNAAINDIQRALDALATAVPVSMDGGAAIQTAFKAVWGTGAPPTPDADVASDRVFVP